MRLFGLNLTLVDTLVKWIRARCLLALSIARLIHVDVGVRATLHVTVLVLRILVQMLLTEVCIC